MDELITNYLGFDIFQTDTGNYYAVSESGNKSAIFSTQESLLTAINLYMLGHV